MYSQVAKMKKVAWCPKTLNWIEDLAGSGLITERDHLNIEKLTALFEFIMPMYNNTKLDCMYENQ